MRKYYEVVTTCTHSDDEWPRYCGFSLNDARIVYENEPVTSDDGYPTEIREYNVPDYFSPEWADSDLVDDCLRYAEATNGYDIIASK